MLAAILAVALGIAPCLRASATGALDGRVLDPQGRSVAGVEVILIPIEGEVEYRKLSDEEGRFHFTFIPVGRFHLEARARNFENVVADVSIFSGQATSVTLRFPTVAGNIDRIEVHATPAALDTRTSSVQSSHGPTEISRIPGASDTFNALLATTNTAWYSQEHLHIRGAHQVGYQVNGIEVPDLSLFGAVTPFIDPRNTRFAEVTTGGLLAEYGNRTAGVVNVMSRSGFDRKTRYGDVELAGGSFGRGSVSGALGGRVGEKFAYYVQTTALASDRGFNPPPSFLTPFDLNHNGQWDILDAPVSQTVHNFRRTMQPFATFDYLPTSRDRINLTLGGYRTDLQVPNTYAQELAQRDYIQLERDQFQNLRWERTVSSNTLISMAGYHHFNSVEVRGQWDEPQNPLAGDHRLANYYGGLGELAWNHGRHLVKAGVQVYGVALREDFVVFPNPLGPQSVVAPFHSGVPSRALQESGYLQDQINWSEHWTISLGGRLDLFQARYQRQHGGALGQSDRFFSPRLGVAYRVGESDTVVFANFAYLYLAPPIEYLELPADAGSATSAFPAGFGFTPTRAEKDIQYDVGVRFLARGFRVRVNQWLKRQDDFLDHAQLRQFSGTGELINPNIFLPVNLTRGRTHGVEVQVRAPRYHGLSAFGGYSLNYAQAIGGRVGGFMEGEPPESSYFSLDHDQRHSVTAGTTYDLERWGAFATAIFNYGSGFPDASEDLLAPYFGGAPTCATSRCRLPGHSTLSFSVGKKLWKGFGGRLEFENVSNRVYPINLGSEFNGSHVSAPRTITVRLNYDF